MDAALNAQKIEFAEYYRRETRWSSVLLFLYVGSNFLLANTYRHWFLGAPEHVPASIWLMEFGILVPSCFAAAYVRYRWSDKVFSAHATMFFISIITLAILGCRYIWVNQMGVPFFNVLNPYFLIGAMAMTGIEFRRLCMIALPVLIAETVLSYSLFGWGPQANFEFLSFATAAFVILVVGWHVEKSMHRTWEYAKAFERLSQLDPLTGLNNRRAFEDRAQYALRQARRDGRSIALAVIDLDEFKRYNDHYGHPAGDQALISISRALSGQARRPLDMAARLGGEEFVILWYDVNTDGARQGGEAVIATVQALSIPHEQSGISPYLTVSLGCIYMSSELAASTSISDLIEQADRLLYLAKQQGRNRALFKELAAVQT